MRFGSLDIIYNIHFQYVMSDRSEMERTNDAEHMYICTYIPKPISARACMHHIRRYGPRIVDACAQGVLAARCAEYIIS